MNEGKGICKKTFYDVLSADTAVLQFRLSRNYELFMSRLKKEAKVERRRSRLNLAFTSRVLKCLFIQKVVAICLWFFAKI